MKKQWISVKCGLSRDPKHRQAMGEGIWLFLHILDIASWEDGIAHDWKDEAAAEDMGMPVRTLREHRRRLSELGYITCNQKQYTQDIVIHNWTNPREYNGQVYNQKQGDMDMEAQSDTQGYTQGSSQDVTPTSNSKNQTSTEFQEIEEQANRKVDAILDMANFPGAKREIRLNSILSYIGSKLGVMAESRKWQEFAKFVDDRQLNHGESLERFINWMTAQKGYDIQFWPPSKMQDLWPQAFTNSHTTEYKHEETDLEKIIKSGKWVPAPERKRHA